MAGCLASERARLVWVGLVHLDDIKAPLVVLLDPLEGPLVARADLLHSARRHGGRARNVGEGGGCGLDGFAARLFHGDLLSRNVRLSVALDPVDGGGGPEVIWLPRYFRRYNLPVVGENELVLPRLNLGCGRLPALADLQEHGRRKAEDAERAGDLVGDLDHGLYRGRNLRHGAAVRL